MHTRKGIGGPNPSLSARWFDAGVIQWQNRSFPSFLRGFDSHRPLHTSGQAFLEVSDGEDGYIGRWRILQGEDTRHQRQGCGVDAAGLGDGARRLLREAHCGVEVILDPMGQHIADDKNLRGVRIPSRECRTAALCFLLRRLLSSCSARGRAPSRSTRDQVCGSACAIRTSGRTRIRWP